MATTTNYSWSTPDDTALVKDGAAAIRTLGSSADTTVKALNPGTTAGDVDYYTTSTAKARVGIGTAGQVLTVNSGATAPEWAAPASGGMTLINTGGTTLSGASTDVSSIPGTYRNLYVVVLNARPATDGSGCMVRVNADANTRYARGTYAFTGGVAFSATSWRLYGDTDNGASNSIGTFEIFEYADTSIWKTAKLYGVSNDVTTPTNAAVSMQYGLYNQTTAITSLRFFPDAGNWTSGTVFVYGVK
jgi:hypothetical protein